MPLLRLQPIIKQRPWGGRKLAELWGNAEQQDASRCRDANGWAESWDVVDLGNDQSRVVDGEFAGRLLNELVRECSQDLLGDQAGLNQFPLLFKFLDAGELLSVQVHPNDEKAVQLGVGPRGKSEAWVIIAAEPGSLLSVGLKYGVDRRVLERHLAMGTIDECLNTFLARVGDVISVPTGTVHAIGGGVALAEIQQPSDVTFRLFDWNRLDHAGHGRTLHIAEAMQCIDFSREPAKPLPPQILAPQQFSPRLLQTNGMTRHEELIRNAYFQWRRHQAERAVFVLPTGNRCHIVSLIAGNAVLTSATSQESLRPGDTLLIPASCGNVEVSTASDAILLDAVAN